MVIIRLKRVGKKNKPYYQLVAAEKSRAVSGKFLEILGSFDPHTKKRTLQKERILYWISVGAQLSETAHNLLVDEGILDKAKIKVKIKPKKQKGKEGEGESKADGEAEKAKKGEETPKKEEAPAAAAAKEEKPAEKPEAKEEKKEEPQPEAKTDEKKEADKKE